MTPRLSARNVGYSIAMAVACLISYLIMTTVLSSVVARDNDVLGGMWAAAAAAFVFRESSSDSMAAGASRFAANCVAGPDRQSSVCYPRSWIAAQLSKGAGHR
jgi:hypothetical protein